MEKDVLDKLLVLVEKKRVENTPLRKDGEVVKENDDLIDALRYCIFMIKKNSNSKSKYVVDKFKKENPINPVFGGFRKL